MANAFTYLWAGLVRLIRGFIRRLLYDLLIPTPGPTKVRQISRTGNMLKYEAAFPTMPTGTDIVSQRFTVSFLEETQDQELGVEATSAQFLVPDAVSVTISLRYVDDAGNVSEPSTQNFMSHDTIPPDAPGAFGTITLLGEEPV